LFFCFKLLLLPLVVNKDDYCHKCNKLHIRILGVFLLLWRLDAPFCWKQKPLRNVFCARWRVELRRVSVHSL